MEWPMALIAVEGLVIVFLIARVADAFLDGQKKGEATRLEREQQRDVDNQNIAVAQLAVTLMAATMQNSEYQQRLLAATDLANEVIWEPAHIVATAISEKPDGRTEDEDRKYWEEVNRRADSARERAERYRKEAEALSVLHWEARKRYVEVPWDLFDDVQRRNQRNR